MFSIAFYSYTGRLNLKKAVTPHHSLLAQTNGKSKAPNGAFFVALLRKVAYN